MTITSDTQYDFDIVRAESWFYREGSAWIATLHQTRAAIRDSVFATHAAYACHHAAELAERSGSTPPTLEQVTAAVASTLDSATDEEIILPDALLEQPEVMCKRLIRAHASAYFGLLSRLGLPQPFDRTALECVFQSILKRVEQESWTPLLSVTRKFFDPSAPDRSWNTITSGVRQLIEHSDSTTLSTELAIIGQHNRPAGLATITTLAERAERIRQKLDEMACSFTTLAKAMGVNPSALHKYRKNPALLAQYQSDQIRRIEAVLLKPRGRGVHARAQ